MACSTSVFCGNRRYLFLILIISTSQHDIAKYSLLIDSQSYNAWKWGYCRVHCTSPTPINIKGYTINHWPIKQRGNFVDRFNHKSWSADGHNIIWNFRSFQFQTCNGIFSSTVNRVLDSYLFW